MICSALLALLALAPSPDRAGEETRKILDDSKYGFCHDTRYPLTDSEARWCPPVGPEKNPRCPAFRSACDAPRAVLQDLGRLSFSRGEGEDTKEHGDGDQKSVEDDPSERADQTGTKSGKRKQPRREVYSEEETALPELGGLGYVLFWVILGGGLLLLWVCWKMWRELQESATHDQAEAQAELELALAIEHGKGPSPEEMGLKRKTFGAALVQILIADVTMSLDNVLAVAGAAHDHPWIMVFGLVLSIGLMGVAATYIAKLLSKYRWIGYVGLVIVLYVAVHMIWDGYRSTVVRALAVEQHNASAPAFLDITAYEVQKSCRPEVGEKLTVCLAQQAIAKP